MFAKYYLRCFRELLKENHIREIKSVIVIECWIQFGKKENIIFAFKQTIDFLNMKITVCQMTTMALWSQRTRSRTTLQLFGEESVFHESYKGLTSPESDNFADPSKWNWVACFKIFFVKMMVHFILFQRPIKVLFG